MDKEDILNQYYRLESLKNTTRTISVISYYYYYYIITNIFNNLLLNKPYGFGSELEKNISIALYIVFALITQRNYFKNNNIELQDHPFYKNIYAEYTDISKRIAETISIVGKNNPLQIVGIYSYLLDNGYLSNNHKFKVSNEQNITDLLLFPINDTGMFIHSGLGNSTNISSNLSDILKVLDINSCNIRISIKEDITKFKISEINSSGYIVDTLEACLWVLLKSENYKEAIIGAINLGEDTDTIGALTGGLAGIVFGYDFIPEEWKEQIARKEYLLDIFEEFSENKYE